MAIRYTEFFKYHNQQFSLYILEKRQESGEHFFSVDIKSQNNNTAILCKRTGHSWEIITQEIPHWAMEIKDLILETLTAQKGINRLFRKN